MTILEFMSKSPLLTFFLALILAECVVRTVRYTQGISDPPPNCLKCGAKYKGGSDDNDDDD